MGQAAIASLSSAISSGDFDSVEDLLASIGRQPLSKKQKLKIFNQAGGGEAYKSLDMIEDRITDDPDSVSTRDLTIIAGVAADKIAKKDLDIPSSVSLEDSACLPTPKADER